MKQVAQNPVNAQQKIMHVNRGLGNTGIPKQQGTTRILYDTLPIDGRFVYDFFKGSQQRELPFSNTGSFGNKLEVGESLQVARAYYSVIVFDGGLWSTSDTLAALPIFQGGELTFNVANSRVIKPIPLLSFVPEFNKSAQWGYANNQGHCVYEFDTDIVIPPLLEYVFSTQMPDGVFLLDAYLRLTIEGVGSIISPRQNF